MEKLFSYGTLQYEEVQRQTFGRLLEGTPDAICGWKLEQVEIKDDDVLAASGQRYHPILVRSDDSNARIDGMVLNITPAELAQADIYEAEDYKRVAAPLLSGGTAWVYVSAKDD